MTERRPSKLPPDAKRRRDQFPNEELRKATNKLYYGDENISEPPGKTSMFRGVVAVGVVLAVPEPGGNPYMTCGGTWTVDPTEPEYYRALADYLRTLADALDKEAMS